MPELRFDCRLESDQGACFIRVPPEVLTAAGVTAGDQLTVGLEFDPELRTLDLPEALRVTLEGDSKAAAAFEKLSYIRKKEFVEWLMGAKQPETQRRRLAQVMALLRGSGRR